MKNSILSQSHWADIQSEEINLAVLPWGATEAHNYHLPFGTDNFETEAIGKKSIQLANDSGAKAILLPTLPFGVNTGQHDIKLTINLNPSTQQVILENILQSLSNSGIKKFLILNGHGGNDFRQILRELGAKFPDMIMTTCNWFQAVEKAEIFDNDGDHADEMETSLMMHIFPELVLPLNKAGKGESKKFSVEALNEHWAWTERKWTRVTKDTGIGNPEKANALKGKKYFDAVCEKISKLILDFSAVDGDGFYS
ncbi:MAG: creatininase family protein [Bacteroidales bacterium]|nr:creatininase family protein [Bacteroidales bacterium]MCF8390684.1 creatininase family protein [Bacteroidales bacterium]